MSQKNLFILGLLLVISLQSWSQATIMVGNGNDTGAGSLRQAIVDIDDGGVITFNSDLTITLATELSIGSKSLTIDGSGNYIIISGNSVCRVFSVIGVNNKTYTISGLTIANGNITGNGGGLERGDGTTGILNVTGCTFTGNTSIGSGGGVMTNGPCNFTNCSFIGNTSGVGGGAIVTDRSNFTNCTFNRNIAATHGGGVFNIGGGTFINCTFNNNISLGTGAMGDETYVLYVGNYTNCLFWNDTRTDLITNDGDSITFSNCAVKGGYAGTGNVTLTVSPFVSTDDLRLNAAAGGGFLCWSSGNDSANYTITDIIGNPRKKGIIDIGAYESSLIGSGTEVDPYQIAALEDLRYLSENSDLWNKSYIQTDDIDASETLGWNGGDGWSPIGNSTIKFTGDYNGQFLTIKGIYISRSGSDYQGLFGCANGAFIENIGLTNVNIQARDNVGGLIGMNEYSSVVSNCYVNGNIIGRSNVAGIAGSNMYSTVVRNSFNNSTITGSGNCIGGLVGYSGFGAVVNDCYNLGNILGIDNIGGVAGLNGTAISNCYSTGTVTGNSNVYALVGIVWGAVDSCFWDTQTSGIPTSSSGTGKTTAEMKILSTFTDAGWDFKGETTNGEDEIWNLGNDRNNGYPYFTWHYPTDSVAIILTTTEISGITTSSANSGGNITSDGGAAVTARGVCWSTSELPTIADSITINGGGLLEFVSLLNGLARNTTYYVRAYATNSTGTFYGEQDSLTTKTFENGAGTGGDPYQIATLEDLRFLSENSTLWDKAFIQTANIDASATNSWNSGAGWSPIGISGNVFSGYYNGKGHIIESLSVNRPSTNYIGFIGFAGGATIDSLGLTNCSVIGYDYVGSFVGSDWYANINNCFSTGTVSGRNEIGGFSGQTNISEVNNCYTTVNISAEHTFGGFTGWNNGTTTNCYSSGSISGPAFYNGGFTGYNTGTITNSFYDLTTSGQNDDDGRGVPKTSAEMKILSTFTNAGWDFKGETTNGTSEIWNLGNERNNGYPYFNWQFPRDPVAIILTTTAITDISVVSAISGGNITSDGGDAVTERGVCWSTSELPTIADSYTTDGDGMGEFISFITGLARNTTYHVRAYATNVNGTFYGEQVGFTTSAMNVTVYVDSSKIDDTDNGLSWKTAKKSLQSALTFAIDGDEIWVKKGTYYPETEVGGTGDRCKTFQMKEGVAIIGGFSGGETTTTERTDFGNGGTNETILSGDIGTPNDNTDNCFHVFYHPDGMTLTTTAVLDGFTITGGNANAANPHSDGGGMCTYSSPTITNVTFLSNSGSFGGGLYTRNSTSIISNALFVSNTASQYGGGMFNDTSSPVLSNVTFSKNSAVSFGGGIASVYSSSVLNNCIVWGNSSSSGNEIFIFDGITTLNYSCYANNPNDVYGSTFIASNNNITSDPIFVDETENDFRLLGSSPCVNTGENSYNTTATDIRGQIRIQNTTIDMGAYEWTSGLDPIGIENNLSIGNQTFSSGAIECFNAYDTITVAGSGTFVTIENLASVEFIAGKSIRFLPGFHAASGSIVQAWITTDESFCEAGAGSPIVALPVEKSVEEQPVPGDQKMVPEIKSVKLYPNPNNGRFTISLTNIGSEATVSVYNMLGVRVYSAAVNEQADLNINLPELIKGIYFVKVVDQKEQFTKKMIVN